MSFGVISEVVVFSCPEHRVWAIGINFPMQGGYQFFPICVADKKEELIEARDMIMDGIDNLMRLEGIISSPPQLPDCVKKYLAGLDEGDKG